MNSDLIKDQTKKAYEFARLKMAFLFGLLIVPLIALSCFTCGSELLPLSIGGILLLIVVVFKWKGVEYSKSADLGVFAGCIAFAIPLVMHLLEICCRSNLEVAFCIGSGLLGGFLVGKSAFRKNNKAKFLILSLLIAGLTATLGCASMGIAAVTGLLASLAFATTLTAFLKK